VFCKMPSRGVIFLILLPCFKSAPVTMDKAQEYLQTFGYLEPSLLMSGTGGIGEEESPAERMSNAVKRFQGMAGLEETGELDEETRKKMAAPRCGVPDSAAYSKGEVMKWDKLDLTFSIDNVVSDMSEKDTRAAVKAAFAVYSSITPLKFEEVEAGEGDIKLRFDRGSHRGCFEAFDGEGGTLAHAFFPKNGRVHFDADEEWTVMNESNLPVYTHTDFLGTAMHEIGHALGLYHVQNPSSIMAPIATKPVDRNGEYKAPSLDSIVIGTLQSMYGSADRPYPDEGRRPIRPAHECTKHVYAALNLPGNRLMLFTDKGTTISLFFTNSKRAIQQVPVSEIFTDGPISVHGAYFNNETWMFMLFNGNQVWGYNLGEDQRASLADGYPLRLPVDSEWRTEAAMRTISKSVIISADKTVATYNERRNTLNEVGHISQVYPNMPESFAGFATINSRLHVGFTESTVFKYDYNNEETEQLGSAGDFLMCLTR
ncbi:hypothetical protein PMAYCL1PPCAC_14557, partial [Pristionchus mayeri]